MTNATIDQNKIEQFAEKMLAIMNHGSLAIMISVGHKTGLFDTMSETGTATSQQIADAGNLNERYVREWLGAMVTGEIVRYDPATKRYTLPAEHAALMTEAATPNNLASGFQFFPMLGHIHDRIVECFKNGGGVPYCEYCSFHSVMADESYQTVVASLIENVLPLVPGLLEKLEQGIEVLDVGCGRGRAMLALAEAFPNSQFAGFDISEEAITWARSQARKRGLGNVRFEVRDIARPFAWSKYDLITGFDVVHDQARPAEALLAVERALKPGGTFLMQDIKMSTNLEDNIGGPISPFVYTISCMHCMSVSLAQGGAGLGAAWGKELALQMLAEANLSDITVHELEHDIQNYWYVVKKAL